MKIKSKAIRKSARGEQCTVESGLCNRNTETTIFAHIPDGQSGMGTKPNDTSGVYACSACHDVIDGRLCYSDFESHRWWYLCRALQRTMFRLVEKGVVTIPDVTVHNENAPF